MLYVIVKLNKGIDGPQILCITLHYIALISIDYSSPILYLATFLIAYFHELCPVIS